MIFIAEFGSNPAAYGWDFEAFCAAARRAGARYGKVQLWRTDVIYPEPMREDRRPLEFPRERFGEFVEACQRHDLRPMASVFDPEAVDLVAATGKPGGYPCALKLAASRWNQYMLIGRTRQAAFERGLEVFRTSENLIVDDVWRTAPAYETPFATVAEYPVGMGRAIDAVISAADTFRDAGIPTWGWSSHTAAPGWVDVALADYLGAEFCEKHFALSHDDPEGAHSLTESEFADLVRRVNGPKGRDL